MNQKNNQRFQENQAAIEHAFFTLLDHKELSRITVREICELAGINRSTFYHHYLDVYDLMDRLEQKIQKEFIGSVPSDMWKAPHMRREVLTLLVGHFTKYPVFYIQYIRSRQYGAMHQGFQRIWENHFIPLFHKYGITSERKMKYYYDFFQKGSLQVILDWLESGCQESPEEIVGVFCAFLPIMDF